MTALTQVSTLESGGVSRVTFKMDRTRITQDGGTFDYITVSRGRLGDTCAFPANAAGGALDMIGIGYEMGPDWHLLDEELETYALECLELHDAGATMGYYALGDTEDVA